MDPRNEKIGILLVDQQTGFLGAATEFLEREDDLTVLGTAGGHAAALAQVRALGPKVILLDPSSPGMGGLGVIPDLQGSTARCESNCIDPDGLQYLSASFPGGGGE